MNIREKNLALLVLFVGLVVGWGRIKLMFKTKVDQLQSRLNDQQAEVNRSRELLEKAAAAPAPKNDVAAAPPRDSRITMMILNELTKPREAENIKFTGVERSGEKSFKLQAQGKFGEMMRFLGMLERTDGKFSVTNGEITRAIGVSKNPSDDDPHREVRLSINLNMKGGT
jgi:hypothetical protein